MSNPSHQSIRYSEHDRVFRNSAPIILQQIIITPIIVHHIITQQDGTHKTVPLVPGTSRIKTSNKRDVEEKSQRREHNANKDKSQDHGPKANEITVRRVAQRQDKAPHSEHRPDGREMVVMHRETFDTLVRARHQESTHSDQVAGNKQKTKVPGLVELSPKPKIYHEANATVRLLKSAIHVRRPGGEHTNQAETTPATARRVKFQSCELGTVTTKYKISVKEQAGS